MEEGKGWAEELEGREQELEIKEEAGLWMPVVSKFTPPFLFLPTLL